ncbi:MAG: hypothetical protein IEMM0008_0241 [bacterium]|nr:MAG: hypothetical protein IEMM0008_0241 [bacterium]
MILFILTLEGVVSPEKHIEKPCNRQAFLLLFIERIDRKLDLIVRYRFLCAKIAVFEASESPKSLYIHIFIINRIIAAKS